jgi:hypothetical protein
MIVTIFELFGDCGLRTADDISEFLRKCCFGIRRTNWCLPGDSAVGGPLKFHYAAVIAVNAVVYLML